MLWQPPRPTLFPYTTLFRSYPGWRIVRADRHATHPQHGFAGERKRPGPDQLGWNRRRECAGSDRHVSDRKSTRLNSSHSQTSYAVFCLKKKKTNTVSLEYET